ncbi:FKBP-type peptidyl-prolyl cis-trans isomerase N-terminal domain-containing protein [Pseudoxanthomonas sacheonensis]|uniref:FKBP-type peptidyl-prolyl cis-trans isomerase N-terminal domain-containing protein n=1 Tax=Pseudoxanthomonas sacheonensis TaxID=443615 RepID=UPI0013D1C757|nr:FKBP-type peptidyl-prolyl cis-trans isomerase N-terminal domain-containing protein [Pseudoxanthomonas sacheonensis]KAF1706832.1 peptidylprolyl isomerase [Pseudoxanthomonas sacheonensis]
MKLRLLAATLAAMTLVAGSAFAQTTPAPDKNALSYALGYDLGRNLVESGEAVDINTVVKALQEGYGKKEPTVPVAQLRTAVETMQKRQMEKAKAAFDKASAENKTKSDAFLAQNKTKAGVQSLPGGIQYRVIEAGSGAKPTQASNVTMQYKGSLSDGRTFVDTFSPQQGQTTAPAPMAIKVSEIPLAGLREAIVQMPTGARWEVVLPADKAYGNTPQSPVGPNQAVVFEVKLVSVK